MAIFNTVNGQQTIQSMQQQLLQAGYPGPWDDASVLSAYQRTTGGAVTPFGAGAAAAGAPSATVTAGGAGGGQSASLQQLMSGMQQMFGAISSGNQAQMAEAQRQFDQTFGLDQQKFAEAVRQFNANFGLSQQGLGLQQQGLGLNALQLAAGLQANPFAQAQVLYGLGQNGYTPAMASAAGLAGPLPAFQAPSGSAAETATLPWLLSQAGGAAGTGMPGAAGSAAGAATSAPGSTMPQFSSPMSQPQFSPTTQQTIPAGQSAGNVNPQYVGDRGLTRGVSNLGSAQQEVGTAPGQGGTLYSGQRGIQFLGYDPATNKVRVMFKTLRDLPIIPKFDAGPISFTQVGGPQALPGNPNGGGWEKVPYYTGAGNGLVLDYQLSGTPDQIRNQQFSATYAQPTEGGLANEALQFSGNDLFNLPNFNAQQQQSAAMAPGVPTATGTDKAPGSAMPGTTGGAPGSPNQTYVQQQVANWLQSLPAPNQVSWMNLTDAPKQLKDLVTQGLAQKWGLDPQTVSDIANSTLPAFRAPTLAGLARV